MDVDDTENFMAHPGLLDLLQDSTCAGAFETDGGQGWIRSGEYTSRDGARCLEQQKNKRWVHIAATVGPRPLGR